MLRIYEKARQMKKALCSDNCAGYFLRKKFVQVWFQFFPSYLSRKKGISATFLSLGLRPRPQKTLLRFPFFYFGNLGKTSIRRGQIFPQSSQHNYQNKILFFAITIQLFHYVNIYEWKGHVKNKFEITRISILTQLFPENNCKILCFKTPDAAG